MGRAYLILIVAFGIIVSMLGGRGNQPTSASIPSAPKIIELGGGPAGGGERSAASVGVAGDGIALQREGDGHFYADVDINGQRIRMLVDTGASDIALTRDDARRAGLAISPGMFEVVAQGAGGDVRGELVTLERVSLGGASAQQLQAMVLDSGDKSLLGQSFLRNFASVQIEGDRMILR